MRKKYCKPEADFIAFGLNEALMGDDASMGGTYIPPSEEDEDLPPF